MTFFFGNNIMAFLFYLFIFSYSKGWSSRGKEKQGGKTFAESYDEAG